MAGLTNDKRGETTLKLYSYWRSSAAWRVRIALALKDIPYEYCSVNLVQGEQRTEEYRSRVHPGGLVPALQVIRENGACLTLTQSLAIIDYLECVGTGWGAQTGPQQHQLLPTDPALRAHVLGLVYTIACDTHPLQNLRVLHTYEEEIRPARAKTVISEGLRTFERLLAAGPCSNRYCVGDQVTLADVVLVPQVYNAIRWQVAMDEFPRIAAICEHLSTLPAFKSAHPDIQPDAPRQ